MPRKSPWAMSSNSKLSKALRKEVDELRRVGSQLSNVAYNLAQESSYKLLDASLKTRLDQLRREWDAIERTPK